MELSEIRENLYTKLEESDKLSDLTPSTMSVLKSIADCVAFVLYIFYADHDEFKDEIETAISEQSLGSASWYYAQCLAFQLGDDITVDDSYSVYYDTIDVDKQIIKYASVREILEDEVTKLKVQVSKADKQQLDSTELGAFTSYMNKIKFAGIHLIVESLAANNMTIDIRVTTNAELINTAGQLVSDLSVYPVRDALNAYIDGIVYGGTFNKTAAIDAMQQVDGVEDVIINTLTVDGVTVDGQNSIAENGAFELTELTDVYIPSL